MKLQKAAAVLFAFVLSLAGGEGRAHAGTIDVFRFDFENASAGALTAQASYLYDGVSATWNTPNKGIENLGSPLGHAGLIQYFSTSTYQSITFTTATALDSISLSFTYQGNTNQYPTFPSYQVSALLDGSSLGTFTNSESNVPFTVTLDGPGLLEAGSHTIQWIAPTFTEGVNSGTEYMALDNVVLTAEAPVAAVPEIDPASTGSVLAMLAGVLGYIEKRRQRAGGKQWRA
jgi:hypothetical protein